MAINISKILVEYLRGSIIDMYEWTDENIENIKFFCFKGSHCFAYLNQSKQADYCRRN